MRIYKAAKAPAKPTDFKACVTTTFFLEKKKNHFSWFPLFETIRNDLLAIHKITGVVLTNKY